MDSRCPMTFPSCLICGCSSITEAFVVPFEGQQYGWVRCPQCRLLWVDPQPDPADIRDQYDEPFFTTEMCYVGKIRYRRSIARKRLTVLSRLLDGRVQGLRFVEVGSAVGFGLVVARDMGFKVSGVEISPYASDQARQRFGLDVFTGTLEESPIQSSSVDVIGGWDLVEHVPDPDRFLAAAAERLVHGGLLVLHTPVTSSPGYRLRGARWKGICPPRHLFLFDSENLPQLARRHGLHALPNPRSWLAVCDSVFRDSRTFYFQQDGPRALESVAV